MSTNRLTASITASGEVSPPDPDAVPSRPELASAEALVPPLENKAMRRVQPFILVGLTMQLAACDLPRDSGGTIDRIRGGHMRVGFVVDTPWVTDSAASAGGVEVALVRGLARELGARIDWVHAPQSELLEALAEREIDLVIGGLIATSPWKQQVAFTRPYYTDTVLVAGPPGSSAPSSIERLSVMVRQGDPVAAQVRKQGGMPHSVDD